MFICIQSLVTSQWLANFTYTEQIFKSDFIGNDVSYENILFYIFDLFFHVESHPCRLYHGCAIVIETPCIHTHTHTQNDRIPLTFKSSLVPLHFFLSYSSSTSLFVKKRCTPSAVCLHISHATIEQFYRRNRSPSIWWSSLFFSLFEVLSDSTICVVLSR